MRGNDKSGAAGGETDGGTPGVDLQGNGQSIDVPNLGEHEDHSFQPTGDPGAKGLIPSYYKRCLGPQLRMWFSYRSIKSRVRM